MSIILSFIFALPIPSSLFVYFYKKENLINNILSLVVNTLTMMICFSLHLNYLLSIIIMFLICGISTILLNKTRFSAFLLILYSYVFACVSSALLGFIVAIVLFMINNSSLSYEYNAITAINEHPILVLIEGILTVGFTIFSILIIKKFISGNHEFINSKKGRRLTVITLIASAVLSFLLATIRF